MVTIYRHVLLEYKVMDINRGPVRSNCSIGYEKNQLSRAARSLPIENTAAGAAAATTTARPQPTQPLPTTAAATWPKNCVKRFDKK